MPAECGAIRALAGCAPATAGAGRAAPAAAVAAHHQHLSTTSILHCRRASGGSGTRPPHETDLPPICTAFCQVADPSCILLYGFKVAFGGGRSTGFGMIYDSLVAAKKYEPKYRLTRFDMAKGKASGRKGRKEKKNRQKKIRGVKKTKGA